jgi:hypothetical protein
MNWKHSALLAVLAACMMSSLVGCEQKKKPDVPDGPPVSTDNP